MPGKWYMVQGTGYRVQGSRFKVQGSRFKVQGSRFKVQGSRFKVQGSVFRVQVMENLKFEETQQFRSRPLWIFPGTLLLFLMGLTGYEFIKQIIIDKPFGTRPASDIEIIFTTALIYFTSILLLLLFYFTKLNTLIAKDGIWIRFVPFMNKKKYISWNQIKNVYIRKYDPIMEFGGYGLRYGFKRGIAYNVSGRWGLQIIMNNNKKILIGTQKPGEIEKFLKSLNLATGLKIKIN
jgi:hypothetical protein